ncbi:MAG: DUF4426 domain-containing protein [bacterium]
MIMRTMFLLGSLMLATATFGGEKQFGDYTIHYSVFNSDFLSADVAHTYGIKRSKKRGVMNISVTKNETGALPLPVPAKIEATAVNIYKQVKPMRIREVKEPNAFYYIAEIPISNGEQVDFNVSADVDGKKIGSVQFQQTFYTN